MKIVLKVICALFLLTPALSTIQIQAKEKTRVSLSELTPAQEKAKSQIYNLVSRVPKYVLIVGAYCFFFNEDPKLTPAPVEVTPKDTKKEDTTAATVNNAEKTTQTVQDLSSLQQLNAFFKPHSLAFGIGKARTEIYKAFLGALLLNGLKQDAEDFTCLLGDIKDWVYEKLGICCE